MAHLIDKDALVAEIEKLYDGEIDTYTRNILDRLKSNIDTLEVKEVDLGKAYDDFLESRRKTGYMLFEVAKHFFELGMEVSNPVTEADRGMAEEIIINLKRVEQDYHIDLTKEMEWLRNKAQKGE